MATCPRKTASDALIDIMHVANAYVGDQTYDIDLSKFSTSSLTLQLVDYDLSDLATAMVSWMVLLSMEPYNDEKCSDDYIR